MFQVLFKKNPLEAGLEFAQFMHRRKIIVD